MPAEAWTAIISAVGVMVSLIGAAAVVSYRVGKIEAELRAAANTAQTTTASAIERMAERLARIEGMFELRLKDMSAGSG